MKNKGAAIALPKAVFGDRKVQLLIGIVLLIAIALYAQWRQANPTSIRTAQTTSTPPPIHASQPGFGRADRAAAQDPLKSEDPTIIPHNPEDAKTFESEKRNIFAFMIPKPPEPACGDHACNGSETFATCPGDCPKPPDPVCGDHSCNGEETFDTCPDDCPPPARCGDSKCDPGETFQTCPSDCERPHKERNLKYIGYMKENGGPIAFLTDGTDVFMGRENDIIANDYTIVKITEESVELRFVDSISSPTKTIQFEGSKS